MRKIFKILSYSLLYLIISVASAYGVITISMNNYTNEQNSTSSGGSTEETVIAEEISTMISNITNSSALGLELEIEIGADGQNFEIGVDGEIDLSNGFENLAVNADINIAFSENSSFDIGVIYKDGNLYFELLNNKFFIATDNLMTSLSQVFGLLGVEMPELGIDLDSLSLDSILGMLSNFEKVNGEDGLLVLQVAIPVVNQIDLICTTDYTLTGLSLPKTSIEGIELAVNGNVSYPEEVVIDSVDSSDYIDLTNVIDLACGLIDFISQDQIGLEYNVSYNDLTIAGRIDVDLNNISAKITLALGDLNANIIYQNGTLYLEAYNIYAKFDIGQIGDVLTLAQKYFDVELPNELIASIVSAIESGDFSGILDSVELPEIDLSSIDLSILESIVKNGDTTSITITDIGKIDVTLSEGKIASIGFDGFGAMVDVNVSNYSGFTLTAPAESYIDIGLLLPTLDNVLAILQNNTFSGQVNIVYGEYSFVVDYTIHTREENSFITLSTSVFGQDIKVNILNNKAYLEISETKLVCDLDNLENVIGNVLTAFGIEFDSSALTSGLKDLINSEINPLLITGLIENENGVTIVLLDKLAITLTNGSSELKIDANYQDLKVSGNVIGSIQELTAPTIVESEYTPIEDIVDSVINVYNYILAKTFYLSFDASYQDIAIVGALNYDESGLSLTATLSYQNLTANVMLSENKVYITAENIKLVFDLNDIDYVKSFLNDYFGVDVEGMLDEILGKVGISLDSSNDSSNLISDILSGIDLETIISGASFNISSDTITLSALDGLNVNIALEENMIDTISVEYMLVNGENSSPISANIKVEQSSSIFNPVGDYTDITTILDYVGLLLDYVSTKQMQFGIAASYGDINVEGKIQLDLTSQLLMSASLNSNDIDNFDISANIEDGMLYFDYSGLCLKIDNNNFKELLVIVLEVLGIDANSIPFLEDIDLDLDFSQIETDIASLEISIDDIVNILKMVKKIDVTGDSLDIILDGKAIYNNENASDLTISLIKENGAIKSLTLSNIYLDETLETKIDATLTFETLSDFAYVDQTKNYIDISGSNELIKALINMTTDTDFHVQGSFDILGSLAGIDISWNVPFDIKINVVGKGDIELYGVVGEIPTMIGVNNDVPYEFGDTESGSDRYLYIYYKDGYIYLYRSEKVDIMFGASYRTYEKSTKISIDTFLADPMYYIQYCFGFTDTIMNAIIESMNNPRTEPMDFGNIIKSFTVQDNKNFTIDLNMHELTNNPDLDSLIVSLGIEQTAEGKNYVGKLQLSLYMPLADIFTLTLSTSDAQIVDYGTEVDMSPLYDFINNYQYASETEWEASNGNWQMSGEILYQINFETNCDETLESQSYHYKDSLALPTLSDYVVDDGLTHKSYHFAGWFEDETFLTQFTSDTMPRKDMTLYAKWEVVTQNYYTITFVTNSDDKIDSITKLEGESIDIPSLTTKEITESNFTSYYEFGGWFTTEDFEEGSQFNLTAMPSQNTTLYAKWNLIRTEYTRSVNVYDGDELLATLRVKVGDTIDFSSIEKVNETTKFYLDKSFTAEMTDFTMPNNDLDIYIRNMYTLTFTSDYGNTETVIVHLYQGEQIEVPVQSSYVFDDGQTARITYTFNGYNSDIVMPNHDTTYSADWTIDEKHYYTVSFDLRWYLVMGCTAGSKMKNSPSPIDSFKVLEGTTIDLTQYAPTCTAYLTAIPIDAKNFKATSWGTSAWGDYTSGGSGFTTITITGDTTLYACWERV